MPVYFDSESLDPALARILKSLQVPKFPSQFPSITEFYSEFSKVSATLEESGLVKRIGAHLDGNRTCRILFEPMRPSYSLGANINQRGQPSFDANLSLPNELVFPCVVKFNSSSSYTTSGSSLALQLPRMYNSLFRYSMRAFSDQIDLTETVNATTQGLEMSMEMKGHELAMRFASRRNKPKGKGDFYEIYGLNRLRSDRFSLLYRFNIDRTRYLKSRPSVPTGGWSFASVVDIPVLRMDSEYWRLSGKAGKFFRLLDSAAVLSLWIRAGLNVGGGESSPVAVNDRFFLGGANEDLVQFPGFKPAGAGKVGTLGFANATAELAFDLVKQIRGTVFVQAGVASYSASQLSLLSQRGVRVSVGCSVVLPMGPKRSIRVIAAKPVVKEAGDGEQLIQIGLNLGNDL